MPRTPKTTTAAKPEPVIVGPLRARLHSPTFHTEDADAAPEDRRWRWRVWRGDEALGMLPWLRRADVQAEIENRWPASTGANVVAKPAAAAAGTVAAVCDAFLEHMDARADVAMRTRWNLHSKLRHVKAAIGDVRTHAVGPDVLQRYVNERLAADVTATVPAGESRKTAPSSVRAEIKALRMAWAFASARTPLRPLPRVKVLGATPKPYTPPDSDVVKLLDVLPADRWLHTFVALAFETGMRLHELAKLKWSWVVLDGDEPEIRIPAMSVERTKTGERTVGLDEDGVRILRAWAKVSGADVDSDARVFAEVTELTARGAGEYMNRALDDHGIPRFSPHGLRRCAVRRFRKAGVPVVVAAAHFGHSVGVMQEVYDSIDEDDRTDLRAKLAAFKAAAKTKATKGKRKPAAVTAVGEA